jgi:hypothetical protein
MKAKRHGMRYIFSVAFEKGIVYPFSLSMWGLRMKMATIIHLGLNQKQNDKIQSESDMYAIRKMIQMNPSIKCHFIACDVSNVPHQTAVALSSLESPLLDLRNPSFALRRNR